MGRVYTVEFENVTVSAAQDFFEIAPADDIPVKIRELELSQFSDVSDAAEEILRIRFIRGHTSSGSGGSSPTPRPLDHRDAAASFTAETNNTTIASAGTGVNLRSTAMNIRIAPTLWLPIPEAVQRVDQGQTLWVCRLMAAPTDALSMSGTLTVEEL